MPAVEAEALLRLVEAVRPQDQGQARVGSGELLVLLGLLVLEVVRAAEIVLGTGAADGGELRVPVQEELDLAFSPPALVVDAPGQVRSHVVALAAHSFQDGVVLLGRVRVRAAELGVEVARVGRDLPQRVGDLVVEDHLLLVEVLEGDAGQLPERHHPVAVEGAARVDRDREGADLPVPAEAGGEEVPDRRLDGGALLAVPVEAQDREAPVPGGRHPDVLDRPRPLDLGQGEGPAGLDLHRGRHLPLLPEVPRRLLARPFPGHAPLALLSREVLGADAPRLRPG